MDIYYDQINITDVCSTSAILLHKCGNDTSCYFQSDHHQLTSAIILAIMTNVNKYYKIVFSTIIFQAFNDNVLSFR